jgi:hypothetical protein
VDLLLLRACNRALHGLTELMSMQTTRPPLQIHMRKYMRRASPASTAFKNGGKSEKELYASPSSQWLNVTGKPCWRRDATVARTFLTIVALPRQTLECSGTDHCLRTIVSGTASVGSGLFTAWTALRPASVLLVRPWVLRPNFGAPAREVTAPSDESECDVTHWLPNTSIGLHSFVRFAHLPGGARACCKACLKNVDCVGWVNSGHRCWLKDVTAHDLPQQGRISGRIRSRTAIARASPTTSLQVPLNIIHHVRDPLHAIGALTVAPPLKWADMSRFDHRIAGDAERPAQDLNGRMAAALHHWVLWNKVLELVASSRLSFESTDYRKECQSIIKRNCTEQNESSACFSAANQCAVDAVLPAALPGQAARDSVNVTWDQLVEIDPYLAHEAARMAVRYGYDTH